MASTVLPFQTLYPARTPGMVCASPYLREALMVAFSVFHMPVEISLASLSRQLTWRFARNYNSDDPTLVTFKWQRKDYSIHRFIGVYMDMT